MTFNESTVEDAGLSWFDVPGYAFKRGPHFVSESELLDVSPLPR
jgi:hypothetical protein